MADDVLNVADFNKEFQPSEVKVVEQEKKIADKHDVYNEHVEMVNEIFLFPECFVEVDEKAQSSLVIVDPTACETSACSSHARCRYFYAFQTRCRNLVPKSVSVAFAKVCTVSEHQLFLIFFSCFSSSVVHP